MVLNVYLYSALPPIVAKLEKTLKSVMLSGQDWMFRKPESGHRHIYIYIGLQGAISTDSPYLSITPSISHSDMKKMNRKSWWLQQHPAVTVTTPEFHPQRCLVPAVTIGNSDISIFVLFFYRPTSW